MKIKKKLGVRVLEQLRRRLGQQHEYLFVRPIEIYTVRRLRSLTKKQARSRYRIARDLERYLLQELRDTRIHDGIHTRNDWLLVPYTYLHRYGQYYFELLYRFYFFPNRQVVRLLAIIFIIVFVSMIWREMTE